MRELLDLDALPDPSLLRRVGRLADRYGSYARSVTPIWTPEVVITTEMRQQAEAWLPVEELESLLLSILRRLCRFETEPLPLISPPPLSWPDLLARLPFHLQHSDPTRFLNHLLAGTEQRLPLLFAHFIPPRFGGGLGRYPGQMVIVRRWLADRKETGRPLRLLDAACGSGEGTWELALAARVAGIPPDNLTIQGSSLGHLEIMAASHLFFPHDPPHQERMRQTLSPLFADGYTRQISFVRDDLLHPAPVDIPYDLILCNGTVGGPFIHRPQQIETALDGLTSRLKPGGVLCLADRFHGGWEKKTPREHIAAVLRERGLYARVDEGGIVAVKCP